MRFGVPRAFIKRARRKFNFYCILYVPYTVGRLGCVVERRWLRSSAAAAAADLYRILINSRINERRHSLFLRCSCWQNCAQITSLFILSNLPTGFPFRLFKDIHLVNAIRRKTNAKIYARSAAICWFFLSLSNWEFPGKSYTDVQHTMNSYCSNRNSRWQHERNEMWFSNKLRCREPVNIPGNTFLANSSTIRLKFI